MLGFTKQPPQALIEVGPPSGHNRYIASLSSHINARFYIAIYLSTVVILCTQQLPVLYIRLATPPLFPQRPNPEDNHPTSKRVVSLHYFRLSLINAHYCCSSHFQMLNRLAPLLFLGPKTLLDTIHMA